MTKAIWFLENLAVGGTFSGGNWTLPLGNMLDTKLRARPARCASLALADSQFVLDMGAAKWVRGVIIAAHTLSIDAKYRLTFSDTEDFAAPNLVTEWTDVFPTIYTPDQLRWEDENFWLGKAKVKDIDRYTRNCIWLDSGLGVTGRYLKVEIDDANNSNGYFDIGYLYVGAGFQPKQNFSWGRGLKFLPRTVRDETPSGTEVFERRQSRRGTEIAFEVLSKSEAMQLFDHITDRDIAEPVFLIPNPDDAINMTRESFLCRITGDVVIEEYALRLWRVRLTLHELIG
ncbi:hypothetical protein [Caenispirillum bisanense]|uniref:Uncharacterized protein n=1 Tax=Caenispirillum bisanense TaxID=414052 RepID=A0A286GN78_9PROT|nr:hypothetical protein [Caenispirillum bisanense]SOD97011.1 hypothetical protein SAMN05421508_106206 [Caenispirillum bisanense]